MADTNATDGAQLVEECKRLVAGLNLATMKRHDGKLTQAEWDEESNALHRAIGRLGRLAAAPPAGVPAEPPFAIVQNAVYEPTGIRLAATPASAAPVPTVTLPEIDYDAAIQYAYSRLGHAQGTKGCVAFARGAEWYRALATKAAPPQEKP